jgi:hypothetical protein
MFCEIPRTLLLDDFDVVTYLKREFAKLLAWECATKKGDQ